MGVQLLAERLDAHENAKIILSHPDYPPVVGFRQDDFTLTGAAQFGNAFEALNDGKNATAQALSSAAQNWMGTDVAIPNLKSQAQSLHQWISSQRPQIPISFTVVRFREKQQPIDHLQAMLVGATMPVDRSTQGEFLGGLLGSPGGYRATGYKNQQTDEAGNENTNDAGDDKSGARSKTWTVKIGKRFQASQLVLLNADCTVSVATVPDGSPQYGVFNLIFEPIVVPNEDDVLGWYGLPNVKHT